MQQLIKKDYAKNTTVFAADMERQRKLLLQEIKKEIKSSGWVNRVLYALAGKRFFGNWS
jgi:tmRNA-binding protein